MLNPKTSNKYKKLLGSIIIPVMFFGSTPVVLAGAGGGSLPLTFQDANLCTINGQTSTQGISIVNNNNVPSGSNTIEITIDKNIISDTVYNGQTVYQHNQDSITLEDLTKKSNVIITVYRLGDGTPTDLEKQHLFFDANLLSGDSYEITIDSSLIANNGVTLGTTKNIDFKVAAPTPPPTDKTALTTAITNAATLLNSKTVGTAVGNVSQAAHDAYNTAITNATAVKNSTTATQAQEDSAVATLAAATTTFNNSVITVAPVDKTVLTAAITNATTILNSKTVGTAVGNVSQAAHDAYNAAIANATAAKNSSTETQAQVDSAVATLTSATTTFNNAVIKAAAVDKSALIKAITNAVTLLNSKKIGTAVGNVSHVAHDAYNTAIVNATAVKNSTTATQAQIDNAVTTLAKATNTFDGAVIAQKTHRHYRFNRNSYYHMFFQFSNSAYRISRIRNICWHYLARLSSYKWQ